MGTGRGGGDKKSPIKALYIESPLGAAPPFFCPRVPITVRPGTVPGLFFAPATQGTVQQPEQLNNDAMKRYAALTRNESERERPLGASARLGFTITRFLFRAWGLNSDEDGFVCLPTGEPTWEALPTGVPLLVIYQEGR